MPKARDLSYVEWKIKRAKSKARPELIVDEHVNEWTCLNLAKKLDMRTEPIKQRDSVGRIDVTTFSPKQFIEEFELPMKPVVLQNVALEWPATKCWTFDYFIEHYGNQKFKCGEDDAGYNVRLKMKYFIHYMNNNCDDSPLYIFDSNFRKKLLRDYSKPRYFREDLFRLVGSSRRPPFRWIVIGSERSGTGIHIDPLGTSAWNTLLVGYKRWCLFPTYTPRELLKPNPVFAGKQYTEAAQWFNIIYPRTQDQSWPTEYRPIEILQAPGETVFVPSGWWHVVINLTKTIAVTQNFVSSSNFPIVWHKTARSRPKLSRKWLAVLKDERPDLYSLAVSMDTKRPIGVMSDSSSGSSSSSSSSDSESCEECSSRHCGVSPSCEAKMPLTNTSSQPTSGAFSRPDSDDSGQESSSV